MARNLIGGKPRTAERQHFLLRCAHIWLKHNECLSQFSLCLGEAVEQTSSLWCLCLAHGPCSNAAWAALIAFSMSAASASETWADFCASSKVDGCKGLAGFARDPAIVDQKLGCGNSNSAVRGLQHYRGHLRNSFRWPSCNTTKRAIA